jgi:hypothetical protein
MKKMKKIMLSIAALAAMCCAGGCGEKLDLVYPPMTGYWQCTGIGGTLGNFEKGIDTKYFSLFSIGYVGAIGVGYCTRVGSEKFSVDGLLDWVVSDSDSADTRALWQEFFSYGSFSYSTSDKTITHNMKNGDIETFVYDLSSDGKTLTLTTQKLDLADNKTVGTVVSAINSLLGGTKINTSVGVVYTYTKTELEKLNKLMEGLAKE